jgi:phenylpyruvate tautomerase PptA (4-oxalocrotonate tautomerase family)
VKIDAFAGRSTDAERALYRQIVERLEPLGVAREQISIVIQDIRLTNWGIRGGSAACDVDLGFDINV